MGTGEVWLGPDALKRQMIDELSTTDDVLLGHVQAGADVYGVKYKKKSKSNGLLGALGDEGNDPMSMWWLALAWLVEKLGSSSAGTMIRQVDELKALVAQQRGGQRTQV